jgi:hypothetical protein
MSLPDHKTLIQNIEETRITYPEREHGIGITGSPFSCTFDEPVDPEEFSDEIRTAEDPWRLFGLRSQLSEGYWKVVGNLFHVEDNELVGSSKFSLEVCSEWVRIYVKEGCSAERAADFVETLDAEYGVSIEFADQTDKQSDLEDND